MDNSQNVEDERNDDGTGQNNDHILLNDLPVDHWEGWPGEAGGVDPILDLDGYHFNERAPTGIHRGMFDEDRIPARVQTERNDLGTQPIDSRREHNPGRHGKPEPTPSKKRQRKSPPRSYSTAGASAEPAKRSRRTSQRISDLERQRKSVPTGNTVYPDSLNGPVYPISMDDTVYVDQPTDDDVLFGRGGRSNFHPGNIRYHEVKLQMQPRYKLATKDKKPSISQELVNAVHDWGGRFLKHEEHGDRWFEVPNSDARRKAGQALRETNTPEARQKRREQYGH